MPCVVGTRTATRVLTDGEEVTVDGRRGHGLRRRARAAAARPRARPGRAPRSAGRRDAVEPLATRLYVNLALPDQAEAVARAAGGRRGAAARGVHAHRGARAAAPAEAARGEARGGVPRRAWRRAAHHRPRLRAAPGHLPDHGLPHQRVPRPRRRGASSSRGGQPDDRLPRLLPLREGSRALPAGAARRWPACARRPRTCT